MDGGATLERGRLGGALGRVALHTGVGLRDQQLDGIGRLDLERHTVQVEKVDLHVLDDPLEGVPGHRRRDRDLLVGLVVHEHDLVLGGVEVGHLARLRVHAVELLAGAEGLVQTAPVAMLRTLVRTNAPPLPGLTCWNSTIVNGWPSISMAMPVLNWLVETTSAMCSYSGVGRRECAVGGHDTARPRGRVASRPERRGVPARGGRGIPRGEPKRTLRGARRALRATQRLSVNRRLAAPSARS